MKGTKFKQNILFFIIIIALLIPQTRQFIQIQVHKGLALFAPSIKSEANTEIVTNYNWQLADINGNKYNFRQAENKVVLVSFWATWCPPCIAELPSMQKLYDDYKNTVEFIFVSNEKRETIKEFIVHNGYDFNIYNPIEKPTIPLFEISSIPRTFLIDKKGTIVIDKSGAANWNSKSVRNKIDELLKL